MKMVPEWALNPKFLWSRMVVCFGFGTKRDTKLEGGTGLMICLRRAGERQNECRDLSIKQKVNIALNAQLFLKKKTRQRSENTGRYAGWLDWTPLRYRWDPHAYLLFPLIVIHKCWRDTRVTGICISQRWSGDQFCSCVKYWMGEWASVAEAELCCSSLLYNIKC